MASDRDTLDDLLIGARIDALTTDETVDVILAAGWRPPARVITDPAEADALPIGTVVINDGGQVAQRYDGMGGWWQVLDGDQWESASLIGTGWIRVLDIPAEEGQADA